jgi:hypothetical protein
MRRPVGAIALVAATSVVLFAVQPAGATYPGKNGLIAFSLDTGNGYQINTIRPNGQGLQQITSVTGSALAADWSPDGTKIVFDIDPNGGEEGCGIFVMDADGSNIVDLTPMSRRGPNFMEKSLFIRAELHVPWLHRWQVVSYWS